MSLKDEVVKIFDDVKAKLSGAVGAEVETDVHSIVEQGKAQATALLSEASKDAQADASAAAGDASKVAADAGSAVAPPAAQ